jgi:hypothetical protein
MPSLSDFIPREWQAPPAEAPEGKKLGWINEANEQGSAWVENQRGFRDWNAALDLLSGDGDPKSGKLSGRRLKTNIRTAISGLSNIRPLWGGHAAEAYASYAAALNKTCWSLYLEGSWDQDIKSALTWAAGTCSGYLRPVYRRNMQGAGNIEIDSFGQPSVLPVQITRDGDFQKAYIVTLLEEVPIYEAHWRFRRFQDRLKPTSSRYWYSKFIRKASEKNALKRMADWFKGRDQGKLTDQYIPLRWTTINDLTINDTGKRIPMGEVGSSWYYEVPSYGDEIPDGAGGMRTADENDCLLYPQRRVIISSEDCVMYDGPGFNWHGELDLIQLCVDKWPWEPIGFSMFHDGWALQRALDEIDNVGMRKVRAQGDPALAYPEGGVTRLEAEQFDPLEPGKRVGYDEQATDTPFKLPMPLESLIIGSDSFQMRQILQEELDYQMGTRDIIELAKARALGKDMDSIEKMIAANGPIVQDIQRMMEKSLTIVGRQVFSLILQYMGSSRIMQYADPATLEMKVFDYDPTSIIPSHLEGEDPHEEDGFTPRPSMYTKMQRAKAFNKNIRFFFMPHSIHQWVQMSFRLGVMQLKARGLPISAYTVMNAWEIPNLKKPEGNHEQEMWKAEQEDEIMFKARMAQILQGLGIDPSVMGGGAGGPKKTGRPSSDQAPPHQETRAGGRPVVSTSQ